MPDGYEPPNFQTVALQHTNVKLTWDADDDGRKRALSAKRATQADIREDDFKVRIVNTGPGAGCSTELMSSFGRKTNFTCMCMDTCICSITCMNRRAIKGMPPPQTRREGW